MNLSVLPDMRAAEHPEALAVSDDVVDLTNAEFLASVRRAGAALADRGVGPGDVVAVMLPNTAAFVVSLFAAWRLGAAVTPINPSLSVARGELPARRCGRHSLDCRDRAGRRSIAARVDH